MWMLLWLLECFIELQTTGLSKQLFLVVDNHRTSNVLSTFGEQVGRVPLHMQALSLRSLASVSKIWR